MFFNIVEIVIKKITVRQQSELTDKNSPLLELSQVQEKLTGHAQVIETALRMYRHWTNHPQKYVMFL